MTSCGIGVSESSTGSKKHENVRAIFGKHWFKLYLTVFTWHRDFQSRDSRLHCKLYLFTSIKTNWGEKVLMGRAGKYCRVEGIVFGVWLCSSLFQLPPLLGGRSKTLSGLKTIFAHTHSHRQLCFYFYSCNWRLQGCLKIPQLSLLSPAAPLPETPLKQTAYANTLWTRGLPFRMPWAFLSWQHLFWFTTIDVTSLNPREEKKNTKAGKDPSHYM